MTFRWFFPLMKSCNMSFQADLLCKCSIANFTFFHELYKSVASSFREFSNQLFDIMIFTTEQCKGNWILIDNTNDCFLIEIINNIARHNLINAKYRQMVFRSARWHCSREFFGNPLVKRKWCKSARGRQPTKFVV